ncbi:MULTISPECIES: hypothetical protein [Rhodococcus]|uniref:hypothetical protein n=1 Tax=Rhodococcus TaxID=1827 RepID=UPI001FF6AB15|nr:MULTISPECIES: hypothetical protein [Rhodococcus]MDI9950420.1 hypothetical protein [Rhodococcus sp. IEGM 1305]UOT02392.1 hypothetical protein MPY17_25955 [Rhodococcus opacus]
MKVDPTELRVLASSMYDVGETIDDIEVRGSINTVGDFMPGCDVPAALDEAGEFIEGAYLRMAQRARRIAVVATGNAHEFEVSEDDFRSQLNAIGARP